MVERRVGPLSPGHWDDYWRCTFDREIEAGARRDLKFRNARQFCHAGTVFGVGVRFGCSAICDVDRELFGRVPVHGAIGSCGPEQLAQIAEEWEATERIIRIYWTIVAHTGIVEP